MFGFILIFRMELWCPYGMTIQELLNWQQHTAFLPQYVGLYLWVQVSLMLMFFFKCHPITSLAQTYLFWFMCKIFIQLISLNIYSETLNCLYNYMLLKLFLSPYCLKNKKKIFWKVIQIYTLIMYPKIFL